MNNISKYSPIIVFAFNRPLAIKGLIESLKTNPESKDSELYIFVDGPRLNKMHENEKVDDVQQYVKTITGFKKIYYTFSDSNKGLGPSIISGVTSVINKYQRAIVLEDDLVLQPNFLNFMNEGLNKYEHIRKVWSICGSGYKITIPQNYEYDAYFCTRNNSSGWATWADRWNSVDWTFKRWLEWKKCKRDFNKWGGSDCFKMLDDCRLGKNKSWAIRFCFNQFLQNKVSIFPIKSLVINDGFDGEGTNCKKYSRFKYEVMSKETIDFKLPTSTDILPSIKKQCLYYSSIRLRIWSRLMYLLYR